MQAGAHVGDVSGSDVNRGATVAFRLHWLLKGLEHLLKLTEQEGVTGGPDGNTNPGSERRTC